MSELKVRKFWLNCRFGPICEKIPALRRIRIDVAEVVEVCRIGEIAERRYAVSLNFVVGVRGGNGRRANRGGSADNKMAPGQTAPGSR